MGDNKTRRIMKITKNSITIDYGCFKDKYEIKMDWRERKTREEVSSMHAIMNNYKRSAKQRGFNFYLTEEQFYEISQKNCYYCGIIPSQKNGGFTYNGIDRIDNTKGYSIDNIVPCCGICNRAKGNLTLPEFKDWIGRVYNVSYYDIV